MATDPTTNYGTCDITWSYQEYTQGKEFSKYLRDCLRPGFYKGFMFSKLDDSTVTIAAGTALLNVGDDKLVHIRTSTSFNLTVAEATPVLYASFSWSDQVNNYPVYEWKAVGAGASTNQSCLGRVNFSGGNVDGTFDYTNRSRGLIDTDGNIYSPGYLKFDSTDTAYMYESSSGVINIVNSIHPQPLGNSINAADAKATPVDADAIGLMDSEDGNKLKKIPLEKLYDINREMFASLWYERTPGSGYANNFLCSCHGMGYFVAAGLDATIQVSEDSIKWVQKYSPLSGYYTGACFGDNLFVLVGSNGNISTSSDANSWVTRTPAGGFTGAIYDVCYSENDDRYVIVGESGTIQTSDDGGVTWIARTPDASFSSTFTAVEYSESLGLYVVSGYNDEIQTSPDAINWTERRTGGSGNAFDKIIYSEKHSVFIGTSISSDDLLETSPNGIDWTDVNPDGGSGNLLFHGIDQNNNIVVVVGEDASIRITSDLVTWRKVQPGGGETENLQDISYGDGMFVAVGGGGSLQSTLQAPPLIS